jgi:hypothetical protein
MLRESPLLSLMLVALAVASGTCPPALRHAHEGGEDSGHRHSSHILDLDHGHPHQGDPHHHTPNLELSSTMRECSVHLHWVLLGFNFSFPATPDGHDPDHPNGFEPVMVRLVEDVLIASPCEPRGIKADVASSLECISGVVCPTYSLAGWVNSVSALPLCDRARLERSGVLLA